MPDRNRKERWFNRRRRSATSNGSAFRDKAGKNLVVNVINYTTADKEVALLPKGYAKGKNLKLLKRYVTSAKEGDDLKPYPVKTKPKGNAETVQLPARSISTFIFSS